MPLGYSSESLLKLQYANNRETTRMHTHELNDRITITPNKNAALVVIWLHGLGADGHDFVPIVPELQLPPSLPVRFIFPHAPIMPVTVNGGYAMRAWYDIYGVSIDTKIDAAGITNSVRQLEQYIAHEIEQGIPTANIVLAGFSQGAVIALTTGLGYTQTLGGIIALSGYLPLADHVLQHANPANMSTPIFLAHGTQDTIVPFKLGEMTREHLEKAGYKVSWHDYPMPHSVCNEEIRDISQWLQSIKHKR